MTPEEAYARRSGINSLIAKRGQYNTSPDPEFDYLAQMEAVQHRAERLRQKAIGQAFTNASIRLNNQYRPPANIKFPNIQTRGGSGGGSIRGKFSGGDPVFASGQQIQNAIEIAKTGRKVGAGRRDIVTALAAALVESGIQDLNYGDRDSIGAFQQRNAWGSRNARLNTAKSARMFFQGGHGGQEGLLDIGGRRGRGIGSLAQDVQVSAYPGGYKEQVPLARQIMDYITRNQGRRKKLG